jgi:hypothetical protein
MAGFGLSKIELFASFAKAPLTMLHLAERDGYTGRIASALVAGA